VTLASNGINGFVGENIPARFLGSGPSRVGRGEFDVVPHLTGDGFRAGSEVGARRWLRTFLAPRFSPDARDRGRRDSDRASAGESPDAPAWGAFEVTKSARQCSNT
jgi:hypothetical protein